jgi:hypothetical protein
MRTLDGSPMNKALPMLLGVTLAGWASATPVFAQNTTNQGAMPQDNSTRAAITPDATMQDVLGEVPQDPNLIPDPMPMNYPFAAPGELPLLHWVDYTKFNARPGSVSDVNFYKDKLRRVDYDENGRVRKTAAPLYYRRMDAGDQGSNYSDQTTAYADSDLYMRPSGMASSGDFIYIVRGNTLYQLRVADMSVAAQTDLPVASITSPGTTYQSQATTSTTNQAQTDRRMRYRGMMAPAVIAVNGDNLFIMRGNTVYQMRTADLSLVSQKDLPAMRSTPAITTNPAGTAPSTGTTSPNSGTTGTGTGNSNNNPGTNGNSSGTGNNSQQ